MQFNAVVETNTRAVALWKSLGFTVMATIRAVRIDQGDLVFIAILDFSTTAADRPAALAQLDSERDEIHAMPGNIAFRVFASREEGTDITVIHEWDDEASFADYVGSESFARSGEVLRPLMTATPVSRRFRAELLETVA
jgi:quinol monooxygenase YgiN